MRNIFVLIGLLQLLSCSSSKTNAPLDSQAPAISTADKIRAFEESMGDSLVLNRAILSYCGSSKNLNPESKKAISKLNRNLVKLEMEYKSFKPFELDFQNKQAALEKLLDEVSASFKKTKEIPECKLLPDQKYACSTRPTEQALPCEKAGRNLWSQGNKKSATELWKFACAAREIRSCTVLAATLIWEKPSNESEGKRLLIETCDQGDKFGCHLLAQFHWDKKRRGEALRFFRKACDLGTFKSCWHSGSILQEQGKLDEAIAYYKKSCHQDFQNGCINLGNLLIDAKKYDEAKKYLTLGCKTLGESCNSLGVLYAKLNDPVSAQQFYRRACDQQRASGCSNLAVSLIRSGGRVSESESLLKKSCGLDLKGLGCENLAILAKHKEKCADKEICDSSSEAVANLKNDSQATLLLPHIEAREELNEPQ